jgi:hypothetical protein
VDLRSCVIPRDVSAEKRASRLLDDCRQVHGTTAKPDRAWVSAVLDVAAPQATIEALVYELRTYGLAALGHTNCRGRLSDASTAQVRDVIARLIRLRRKYLAITDDLLLKLGEQL